MHLMTLSSLTAPRTLSTLSTSRSMYAETAASNSSDAKQEQHPQKRGRRAVKTTSGADDTFEDVIKPAAAATRGNKATASHTAAAAGGSKHANGKASKRASVEWHDEDEDDNSSLATRAAKRKQSKADRGQSNKRRRKEEDDHTAHTETLPQPPRLPAPPEPAFSADPSFISSSSSSLPSSISRDLFSFLESTLRADVAELETVYGYSDATSQSLSSSSSSASQQQPHSHITGALTQITNSFLTSLVTQLLPPTTSASASPAKHTAASSGGEDVPSAPSPLLAFYSSLVALLPPCVEQAKRYAASLSTHATLPSPSLSSTDTALLAPTPSSSSSPPAPLPLLIQSGFSALSINTDIVLGELRERKRELERNREWRRRVTERINKQAIAPDSGRDDEAEPGAVDDEATETTRKNRLIKKIIKGS